MNISLILCVHGIVFLLFILTPFGMAVAQEPLPSGKGPTTITRSNNTQNQSNAPNSALPPSTLSPLFK